MIHHAKTSNAHVYQALRTAAHRFAFVPLFLAVTLSLSACDLSGSTTSTKGTQLSLSDSSSGIGSTGMNPIVPPTPMPLPSVSPSATPSVNPTVVPAPPAPPIIIAPVPPTPIADTTPPVVSITAPAAAAKYAAAQTVTVTANATDNVGVTRVDFYNDGVLMSSSTKSPYSANLAISMASNGNHSLTAKAYDAAGNVGSSAAVAYTVFIAAPPAPPAPVPAPVPPAPPVAGASGAGPNEPSGFATVRAANPFNTIPTDSPTVDQYGYTKYYGNSGFSILQDAAAPASPSNFMRLLFPAGSPGGAAPNAFVAGQGFSANGNKTKIYTRIHMRVSSNWTDNGNTGTKFFFYDQSQGNNHYVGLTDSGDFHLAVNLQSTFGYGTPAVGNAPCNQNVAYSCAPNHQGRSLTKGVWHDVEILLEANTPGQYNGIAKVWVDGTISIDVNNMGYFAAGQTPYFDIFWVNPT